MASKFTTPQPEVYSLYAERVAADGANPPTASGGTLSWTLASSTNLTDVGSGGYWRAFELRDQQGRQMTTARVWDFIMRVRRTEATDSSGVAVFVVLAGGSDPTSANSVGCAVYDDTGGSRRVQSLATVSGTTTAVTSTGSGTVWAGLDNLLAAENSSNRMYAQGIGTDGKVKDTAFQSPGFVALDTDSSMYVIVGVYTPGGALGSETTVTLEADAIGLQFASWGT